MKFLKLYGANALNKDSVIVSYYKYDNQKDINGEENHSLIKIAINYNTVLAYYDYEDFTLYLNQPLDSLSKSDIKTIKAIDEWLFSNIKITNKEIEYDDKIKILQKGEW